VATSAAAREAIGDFESRRNRGLWATHDASQDARAARENPYLTQGQRRALRQRAKDRLQIAATSSHWVNKAFVTLNKAAGQFKAGCLEQLIAESAR